MLGFFHGRDKMRVMNKKSMRFYGIALASIGALSLVALSLYKDKGIQLLGAAQVGTDINITITAADFEAASLSGTETSVAAIASVTSEGDVTRANQTGTPYRITKNGISFLTDHFKVQDGVVIGYSDDPYASGSKFVFYNEYPSTTVGGGATKGDGFNQVVLNDMTSGANGGAVLFDNESKVSTMVFPFNDQSSGSFTADTRVSSEGADRAYVVIGAYGTDINFTSITLTYRCANA
jgi:hypothetical protein